MNNNNHQEIEKIHLYLAGSITLWKEEFLGKYSHLFNTLTELFEPGKMAVPHDHRKIIAQVALTDSSEIQKSDAVIAFMKPYTVEQHGGPIGTDSSWECGFAHGLKKPIIALIDSEDQIEYYKHQWMVTYHIDLFITCDKRLYTLLSEDMHFTHNEILLSTIETLEFDIYSYVKNKLK